MASISRVKLRALRANERFEVALKGYVYEGISKKLCLVHDISESGFLLVCTEDYVQGQVLQLCLENLWQGGDFEGMVQVCHLSNYGVGVRVVECSENSAKALQGYINGIHRKRVSQLTSADSGSKLAAISAQSPSQ